MNRTKILVTTFIGLCASHVIAAPQVDEQYMATNGVLYSGNIVDQVDWSQTFTVGINGLLTGFDAWLYHYSNTTEPLMYDTFAAQI